MSSSPPVPRALEQKWPDILWIVRHGQSAGNVARDAAESARHPLIDVAWRDMDTPLSSLGEEQARALGRWFGAMPREAQPTIVLCSPYVRARETARIVLESAGIDLDDVTFQADERLREKEFGALDRLTKFGIKQKFPELALQRAHVGKFYFRPPGGESWCDVILRLRSMLDTITREHRRERLLIVGHQIVVNCYRYLIERMDEAKILEIDRAADVPNCSVTSYAFDATLASNGKLVPKLVNFVAPLEEAGAPVTAAPDVPAAPKS
ncbi:MAG TPA: histidine phosphatase family protein [Casimicrobiaceae bacterium]|nr:histidine phosphatase family protein [Casimicrobiaceae bacterium]